MKRLQVIIIVALLIFTTAATASDHIKQFYIKAFDRGVVVAVDGKQIALSSNPLIIDGKVMFSARDVAHLLGKPVVWNSANNVLNFSSNGELLEQVVTPVKPAVAKTPSYKYIEQMQVSRNVGPFYQLAKRKIAIAGTRYNNGIVVDFVPGNSATTSQATTTTTTAAEQAVTQIVGDKAEVKILLNGSYAAMNAYIGVEDGTMNSKNGFILRIYNDGVLRYETDRVEPGDAAFYLSKDLVGNLSGVKILKIEVETQPIESGLGSAKVTAALANFKLYKR